MSGMDRRDPSGPAVVGDRILYGFNRGGYRLHTVALSTLAA